MVVPLPTNLIEVATIKATRHLPQYIFAIVKLNALNFIET